MQVQQYLKLSVLVAVLTIALKTAAWWWTGSVGLLSDALESGVNLAGALFGLAMVTIARRPPDEDHPFGHHKAEYFSSAFEGALILIAALGIAWAAIDRLRAPQPLEQLGVGMVLSLVSTAINGALAWKMLRAARVHRSIALEADARHLFTDVWTSVGVVAGLIGVMVTGWTWLDPLLAILVALNILREAVHLMWRSTAGLMDMALDPEDQRAISSVLQGFESPELRFDHVATRVAGQRRYVDFHLHVPARWTLGEAAKLRGEVEQALMRALPGIRASIQLLPVNVETRFEQQAAKEGTPE
ncbi:cation diffusion facilitator family transporter [Roseateles chitinivorans]|jgi:cation diffusion facilitator family transporter|uniref:Cation diffusion facilitator family transporter n=1 Tax=Roseateles chitinivorans TaxID=2917965 RepID=A0A2G9C8J1_9BURK|nr:cation diffusion facilitator family transporter [Roseateles chitinivorans]PIM51954.1 cation diffusion facilitator family transporter [Roseateles chitinivorans]